MWRWGKIREIIEEAHQLHLIIEIALKYKVIK